MKLTVMFAPPNAYFFILVIIGVYGKNSTWNHTAPLAVINGPLKECSLLLTFLGETCLPSHFPCWNICCFTFFAETCIPFYFPCPKLDAVSQDQFPIDICPSSPFLPSQVLNGQYHSVIFLCSLVCITCHFPYLSHLSPEGEGHIFPCHIGTSLLSYFLFSWAR